MTVSKDIKDLIQSEYKYKTELHCHTSPVSRCSGISPEEMVGLYSSLGFDTIVITNHFIKNYISGDTKEEQLNNYMKDYEKAKAYGEKLGLRVLLGAELRFTENINDYLVYGVDREILSVFYDSFEKGFDAFRKEIKLENSFFAQAHPKRDGMEDIDPSLLDGVEVFNLAPAHNPRLGYAAVMARENRLLPIGGSDFHGKINANAGLCALRTKTLPEDSFTLAKLLKSGDYVLEIGESLILP